MEEWLLVLFQSGLLPMVGALLAGVAAITASLVSFDRRTMAGAGQIILLISLPTAKTVTLLYRIVS